MLRPATSALSQLTTDVSLTSVARGDVLYRGASKWNNLAAGTSGHFLKSNGAGADPSWAAASASPGGSNTQIQFNSSGSFGGAAALVYAASGVHLTATAQAATDVPIAAQMHASQSANAVEVRNSSAAYLAAVGPQSTVNDSLAFGLRPGGSGGRSYYAGTYEAAGYFKWMRSDSTGYLAFEPSVGLLLMQGAGSYAYLRTVSNSTIVLTAREDGGATTIDFNRRPNDDSTGVGGTVRCWTKSGQTANAFEVLTPGGGGKRFLLTAGGVAQQWEDSSTTNRQQFDLTSSWATSTDASRKARAVFSMYDTAARECLRLEASGSAAMIGFLGAAASARVTISGSRANTEQALKDLLTELAAKGLITDSTSA